MNEVRYPPQTIRHDILLVITEKESGFSLVAAEVELHRNGAGTGRERTELNQLKVVGRRFDHLEPRLDLERPRPVSLRPLQLLGICE
jgi:hypothetical protein